MKRWLLIGLPMLLAALVVALLLVVGTDSGTRALVAVAQRVAPGSLQVQSVEGNLLGDLRLDGLDFQHAGLELSVDQFELRWTPGALLQGTLHVALLGADGVRLRTPSAAEEAPEAVPVEGPPELQLPVSVRLDRLSLRDVQLASGDAGFEPVVNELELVALRLDPSLALSELRARGPAWEVRAEGSAEPYGDWPLDLQLSWSVEVADRGRVSGSGSLSGDVGELDLVQRIRGIADALVQAQVRDPFGTMTWNLRVGLMPSALAELNGAELAGRLDAHGDLQTAEAEAHLGVALPETGPLLLALRAGGSAEAVQIHELNLRAPTAATRARVDGRVGLQPLDFELSGSWRALRWPLVGTTEISSPNGHFQLSGGLEDLQAALEAQLTSRHLNAPGHEGPPLELTLRADSDPSVVYLRQATITAPDSPLRLLLKGRYRTDDGAYQATASWSALRWPLTGAAVAQAPRGNLEVSGQGSAAEASVESYLRAAALGADGVLPTLILRAQARNGAEAELQRLEIRQVGSDAKLDLSASIDPQDLTFAAQGDWQALAWPLVGISAVTSQTGKLSASGTPDDYRASLDLELGGAQVPPGQWHAALSGSRVAAVLEQLRGDTLGGTLRAQAEADWGKVPTWHAKISGSNLQPDQQWPDVPGRVAFKIQGEGSAGAEPDTWVQLVSLDGSLLGQTLSGGGEVRVTGESLHIPGFDVALGSNRVQASGSVDQRWALQWSLQAPNLDPLLPALDGQLAARGELQGPRARPGLQFSIDGTELALADNRIASLSGRGKVDLAGTEQSQVELTVTGVAAGRIGLERARLEAGGRPQQHVVTLSTSGDVALQTRVSGSLDQDSGSWTGQLEQLQLSQPIAGTWRLAEPSSIWFDSGALDLERSCLVSTPARLCLVGNRSAEGAASAELALSALSLARLAPLLPAGLAMRGSLALDGKGALSANGVPTANLDLRLDDGQLALDAADGQTLELDFQNTGLRADLEAGQALARLNVGLRDRGALTGRVVVADPLGSPTLEGTLEGQLGPLDFLPVLVPAVAESDGRLELDLQFSGPPNRPVLAGEVNLRGLAADIPAAGLALREGRVRLAGQEDGRLQLVGNIASGAGRLGINGTLNPASTAVDLRITGDRFQAADTQTLALQVSPRLAVQASPSRVNVTGEVGVPEALIQPPDRAGAVTVSDDTVIVGTDDAAEQASAGGPAVSADVTVRLGDEVRVQAYGLAARLVGTLRLRQEPGRAPLGSGAVEIAAGTYVIFGQELEIDRGRVLFAGPLASPGLDLRAVRRVEDVVAGVQVTGPIRRPQTQVFSEPAMPQSEALSYLLFGRPPGTGQTGEGQMLSRALSALAASGGDMLGERIVGDIGLDELSFESGETVEQTSLNVGKYITPDLYFRYGVGLMEPVSTFLVRYRLSDRWSIESFTGTESSGADIHFELER